MPRLAALGGAKTVTADTADRWPLIGEEEIELVVQMLKRGEISSFGAGVMLEFEREFARFIGVRHALSHCNGTTALEAAYHAAGVGPGDEVIVPAYTWHAQVCPIVHCGGVPVFCEIDPATLTADPADIRRRITPYTRAISVVHLWGNVADLGPILEIAREHRLPLIEDCSHAHGAEYRGRKCGSWGDIGCFSLQASKPMVAGEGGMLVTDNTEYFERALVYAHHGRFASALVTGRYRHLLPWGFGGGHKFRAHPLGLGIASVQMKRLPEVNRRRAELFAFLNGRLAALACFTTARVVPGATRGGYYEFRAVYHPERLGGVPRDLLLRALQAEGVPVASCHYPLAIDHPLFNPDPEADPADRQQAAFRRRGAYRRGSFPITEDTYARLIAMKAYTDPEPELFPQIAAAFEKVVSAADELKRLATEVAPAVEAGAASRAPA